MPRSRNMIGWFMKTYLHKPVKILQVLSCGKTQNITLKFFSIFNRKPLTNWVTHITRDFLTCYSCSYYSPMVLDSFYIKHASLSESLFHKAILPKSYGKMLSWQRFYIMAVLSNFSVLDYILKFWVYIFQSTSG